MTEKLETATVAGGCFWCIEAVFQQLKGVHSATSGYAGGQSENPTYRQVCSGTTGHAEVVQIKFDPDVISFGDLLYVFWRVHDPTTLNRQGADVGTQYRSAIFFHNEGQKATAEKSLQKTDASDLWPDAIVTEIAPLVNYHPAEDYHNDYFQLNPNQPYCRAVIDPKVTKFRKEFSDKIG